MGIVINHVRPEKGMVITEEMTLATFMTSVSDA